MFKKGSVLQLMVAGFVLLLGAACQQEAAPPLTPGAALKATAPTATAKPAAAKPVRGGTLRVSLAGDPDSLDPHVISAASAISIAYNIFDNLVTYDPDMRVTKDGLAIDWEPAKDGKSFLVKLRKGVKFQDGTDFDAAAVKFNVERLGDPATKSPVRSHVADIASVEVIDDYTARFQLNKASPALMEGFAQRGGLMVSPAAVKKYGQDFGRNPVGTGPFQFVQWKPGSEVALKRSDAYWRKDKDGGALPYLDGVRYTVLPDESVSLANLRTGGLDMFVGMPYQDKATVLQNPDLTTSEREGGTVFGYFMNESKPPFDNKALRQAVQYVVDRKAVVEVAHGGGAEPVANYLTPANWAYDPNYKWPYPGPDLEKAKAKMAEAGYPQGMKFEYTAVGNRQGTLQAEILQAALAKVGVTMEIKAVDSSLNLQLMNTLQYSMGWSGWGVFNDPQLVLVDRFHSKAAGRNRSGFNDPKVDAILDRAGGIYDQKERTALYRQVGETVMEDASVAVMLVPKGALGLNKKVKNFVQYTSYERYAEVWLAQ